MLPRKTILHTLESLNVAWYRHMEKCDRCFNYQQPRQDESNCDLGGGLESLIFHSPLTVPQDDRDAKLWYFDAMDAISRYRRWLEAYVGHRD